MESSQSSKRQPDQTRQRLLESAFEEIHRNGFRGASLETILKETGVTKGALYHHFGSKSKLGLAVIDELIRPFVEENWKPVLEAENVIDGAIALTRRLTHERNDLALQLGCPFNNLIQEMSPIDEDFRALLNGILQTWRKGVVDAMTLGQQRGQVRDDIDPVATADFLISAIEGCVGLTKASHSDAFYKNGMQGLEQFLEQLRPDRPHNEHD
ncbi:TetR family transcriptional regulator [Oceanococcus atlanticus]|uniref:TetR family transcriptional regulator n=1 Tax=Oceanococcus atlanticus TaxID=1317117 RepID=A0A1Y1SH84_9GAMM|nr:TetR/AcrR family transcriptional regulator [Oceanococcus atlanticus]ORE89042.1 TetR family transcriptional regulator [Oceanococcus atlanticus]RZO82859.1 MAG: TetR/AcrR family transcriptional regulator [Oceanococcus sp.]